MKIEVSMQTDALFEVHHWWAKKPEFVIETLRAQMKAASAIWPELRAYSVGKRALAKPSPDKE